MTPRREARRSAGAALGAKDGVALASAVTARHVLRARTHRRIASTRVARIDRLRSIERAGKKRF